MSAHKARRVINQIRGRSYGYLIENMARRLPERGSHLSPQHLPPTPEMVEKVDLVNEPDREVALPVPSSYSNRRIYKRD
jgi:hypothetical protein